MKVIYLLLGIILMIQACQSPGNNEVTRHEGGKLKIVTTTTMITDLVKRIGGEKVEVEGLMGAGIDPHLYKASEGDVSKLFNANMVFYNGLHLEGKLEDVFEKLHQQGKKIIAVSDTIDRKQLISSANFASNYDPHIWFDLSMWRVAAIYVASQLAKQDTANEEYYRSNLLVYEAELDSTQQYIIKKVAELNPAKRVLITAHDAFNYFGRAYNFVVIGLQGISTASEAGVKDVQSLAGIIVEKKVRAIFVESSVPRRNVEALQEAVRARGHNVMIGGELFSDALGSPDSVEGTYTGMFKYNVNTIVNALK